MTFDEWLKERYPAMEKALAFAKVEWQATQPDDSADCVCENCGESTERILCHMCSWIESR